VSDPAAPADEPQPETDALQRLLDLLVYAPVGVVVTVTEDLPGLITKGRQRLGTEISNARVVGEFFVNQGQREVTQRLGSLLHRTADPEPEAAPTPSATPAAPAPAKPAPDPVDGETVERALAGYDTLSASQVVRRLESLGPDELHAVHRHEASHRNRRTILNRATQLLEAGSAPPAAGAE
jgi:hypothetical protein